MLAVFFLPALIGLGVTAALGVASALRPNARARRRVRRALRSIERECSAHEQLESEAGERLVGRVAKYEQHAQAARLDGLELEDLRKFGAESVRWGALRDAGIASVGDVRRAARVRLLAIDGIGPKSAQRLRRAAKKLTQALSDEPAPLPATGDEHPATLAALRAAHDVLQGREATEDVRGRVQSLRAEVAEKAEEVERGASLWRSIVRREGAGGRGVREVAGEVSERMRVEGETLLRRSRDVRAEVEQSWRADLDLESLQRDHEERNADYCALIEGALAGQAGDSPLGATNRAYGGLPNEIARRVEAFELDARGLRVTLRRYQEFGAKFALAQERVLIGDEMGLGKTIEALAILAHLRAVEGVERFLVVSPASILHNWKRETEKHSDLEVHLLHGSKRDEGLAAWRANGGVAVTSFGTLKLLRFDAKDGGGAKEEAGPEVLIVDEAHYAKNPEAGRTRAVHRMALTCRWVLFLTGTPIENRLEEFRELVRPLRPEVAKALGGDSVEAEVSVARSAFLRTVSPVYLRRNQPDVLSEIPPRVDKEEWIPLRRGDQHAYREAVLERNAMAMRVAATLGDMAFDPSIESAKIARLRELLTEYEEEGVKVIVFSYFLDVLNALASRFEAHGPITGAVAPAERMAICDRFQAGDGHALLLSQIQAGGVGLNLQAASVVVLMEPQWKPSSEEQAIARAHRMGQTRTVVVHRMLARDSIDERMVEALAEKRELFDDFARKSLVKEASAQATESELVRRVVEAEVARIEAEGVGDGAEEAG